MFIRLIALLAEAELCQPLVQSLGLQVGTAAGAAERFSGFGIGNISVREVEARGGIGDGGILQGSPWFVVTALQEFVRLYYDRRR